MSTLLLKPFLSDIHYRGQYSQVSLTLVISVFSVFEKLLSSFSVYGTSLNDFKVEGATLSDLHLTCALPKVNTTIRFYLDRMEIDFGRVHQIGEVAAIEVARRAWAIVEAADASIRFLHHEVTLDTHADLLGGSAKEFIERYVSVPPVFGEKAMSAVIFTTGSGVGGGDVQGSRVLLDRSLAKEGALYTRIYIKLDGGSVSFERVGERASQFITSTFEQLGLKMEQPA